MIVKYSKERVWWSVGDDNLPSLNFFNSFKSRMITNNDIKVNFVSYDNIELISKTDDITYLWVNHANRDYFYIVNGVDTILSNGYKLSLILDPFTTFTLPFLKTLSDNHQQVKVLRSHNFNDESYLYNDEMLNSIAPIYTSKTFVRSNYKVTDGWITSVDDTFRFKLTNETNNAVKYYVFREGLNSSYTFIPLMQDSGTVSIQTRSKTYALDKTINFTKITGQGTKDPTFRADGYTSVGELDTYVSGIIRDGGYVEYYYPTGFSSAGSSGGLPNFNYQSLEKISDVATNTLPSSMNLQFVEGSFKGESKLTWYVDGRKVNEFFKGIALMGTKLDANQVANNFKGFFQIKAYKVSGRPGDWTSDTVDNTYDKLEAFKLTQFWSEKFLGVFYLPNILNFSKNLKVSELKHEGETGSAKSKFICLYPRADGLELAPYKVYQGENLVPLTKFNQEDITNINFYKYIPISYYNNDLNYVLRKNSSNEAFLGGYFTFSSNGVLVNKPSLLSPVEAAISFPYQLPSGTDSYTNYVNGTINSANASYNLMKLQYEQQRLNGILGIVGSGVSTVAGAASLGLGASALGARMGLQGAVKAAASVKDPQVARGGLMITAPGTGIGDQYQALQNSIASAQSQLANQSFANLYAGQNVAGGAGAVGGGLTGIASGIVNLIYGGKIFDAKVEQMRASYADKKNVLGNQIAPSQVQDLAWSWYMDAKGTQYEGVEIANLSSETIKQMNNVLYLYGNTYIEIDDINKFLNIDFNGFRYVLFDEEYISNLLPLNVDLWVPKIAWTAIITQLAGGIRLWDKQPQY